MASCCGVAVSNSMVPISIVRGGLNYLDCALRLIRMIVLTTQSN